MKDLGNGGSIILASSIAGLRGTPGKAVYGMSKFALRGLALTAATELGPYGIRVNTVHPSGVDGPMFRGSWSEAKLEQLKAEERLGHIVCELWHRLNFVGLADAHGFNMPLLQTHLANACGTTAVHINRVIKAVRQRGLLEINRGRVTLPDRPALERFSHFTPDYLYGHGSLYLSEDLREP